MFVLLFDPCFPVRRVTGGLEFVFHAYASLADSVRCGCCSLKLGEHCPGSLSFVWCGFFFHSWYPLGSPRSDHSKSGILGVHFLVSFSLRHHWWSVLLLHRRKYLSSEVLAKKVRAGSAASPTARHRHGRPSWRSMKCSYLSSCPFSAVNVTSALCKVMPVTLV